MEPRDLTQQEFIANLEMMFDNDWSAILDELLEKSPDLNPMEKLEAGEWWVENFRFVEPGKGDPADVEMVGIFVQRYYQYHGPVYIKTKNLGITQGSIYVRTPFCIPDEEMFYLLFDPDGDGVYLDPDERDNPKVDFRL